MNAELNNRYYWESEHASRQSEFDELTQKPSDFAIKCSRLLKPCSTILELGSARGRDAAFFVRDLRATVFAVDIAHNALTLMAKDYPDEITNIHRINASNANLPIKLSKNQFDAIYARSAIYEDDNSFQNLLKQLKRSLKPDGYIMLEGKTAKSKDIEQSKSAGVKLMIDKEGHIRRVWEIYNSLELIVKAKLTLIDYGFTNETWRGESKSFLYMICQIFRFNK